MRSYHRQVKAQIFFQVSERYHSLLHSFPIQFWTARLDPSAELPERDAEFTAGILRYLLIVHFAYVLRELGYLQHDLWKMLQAEHKRTLIAPMIAREWPGLRREFEFFPKFVRYIDRMSPSANVG